MCHALPTPADISNHWKISVGEEGTIREYWWRGLTGNI